METNRLSEKAAGMGICLTDKQQEQFILYRDMLLERNKTINLTSITDPDEVIDKHFIDSLSLVYIIKDLQSSPVRLTDIGTGAGFPGIPVKIAFPFLDITLVDSLEKRVKFLEDVIDRLSLKGIRAVHSRAEDLARNSLYRESFDICVSRAVANLATLSEYCLPFVKTGGFFVAYKSGNIAAEMQECENAVRILGGQMPDTGDVTSFLLPETSYSRTLLCIKKIKATPSKYPRKAGTPSRKPLK